MSDPLRYLLLQVRNDDDPMRDHEVQSFARALGCPRERIAAFDLLSGAPSREKIDDCDVVLLGGSGDYSVAEGGDWLPAALETMRRLAADSKPTFASCWGFQAVARALGGEVVTDLDRAELGTIELFPTPAGRDDPLFSPLGETFRGQAGHRDVVRRLPDCAVLLASSRRCENQAFRIAGKPIYCTQFHPELDRAGLLQRVRAYPQYIEKMTGLTLEEFDARCMDAPATEALLSRFATAIADGEF